MEGASERPTKRLFVMAALLHALAYFFAVSPWMGEDEPWQFEYASHVASGHLPRLSYQGTATPQERMQWSASALQTYCRFDGLSHEEIAARQSEILASMAEHRYYQRVDWAGAARERSDFDEIQPVFTAATQPPAYYLVLGAWLALWPGDSIESQLLWARGLSLLLYLATVWAAWEFAHAAFSDPWLALAAALAIAWFPMNVRQAAVVNNDVLARTLGTLVFMLCARRLTGRGSVATWGLAAAAAASALLVKSTAVSVVIALLAAVLVSMRGRARAAALASGALALVAWVWHARNTPVVPKSFEAFWLRVERGFAPETFAKLGQSFVGTFNWDSRPMASSVYVLFAVVGAVALVSALVALWRTPRHVSRPVLGMCFVALASQIVLVVLRGMGHGRYLMPVLPAIAVIVVVGLLARRSDHWRPRAAGAFAFALVAYDALFLWGGLVPNEYLVWGS